jgi:hypothetical protein
MRVGVVAPAWWRRWSWGMSGQAGAAIGTTIIAATQRQAGGGVAARTAAWKALRADRGAGFVSSVSCV